MPRAYTKTQKKSSSNKKKLLVISVIVLVFIVLPVTALAYEGFVPGLTSAMGVNKPVDLGIRYSSADFDKLSDNSGFGIGAENYDKSPGVAQAIAGVTPGSKLVIYGSRTNEATITQEELTAFVNMLPWTSSPLSKSQIRLSNGTFEFSGNVKARYVANLVKSLYPTVNYGRLSPWVKIASHLQNPAIYSKMSVSVDNTSNGPEHGRLQLKVLALKINRTDLTQDVSDMNPLNLNVGTVGGLGLSLGSLNVSDQKLDVYGTLPANFAVGNGNPGAICSNFHGGPILSLSPVDGRLGSVVKQC